ncbi:MazG nucleotide pyrophosphohydrolase domain-containing protein [Pontibacter sp. G13]|uniref:MazG nucleotide pyrophosphohydrolase domain-containing protein n=1 Tax=Pontibacter sp. G13 TaxID=3074898 RepID=UPI002889EEEA|nr:MazG nucleotide pyrophosphohydrolase domain-containing protein [Pontibacter sp. G13]WNJ19379.1 MazG nucleotide pyrophosphohydrolase domain-containing protein [Pontibacter sp. G13]
MPIIPDSPTLSDLQKYQDDLCKERGWDTASDLETWLLFSEEIGELAKAIRNHRKLYQEAGKSQKPSELAGEFADVLSYLMELANRMDINLEQAYRDKEAKNAAREWNNGSDAPND